MSSFSKAETLEKLKAQYEELKTDAYGDEERFQEKYEGELNKLIEAASGQANLDLVIAAREELANYKSRDAGKKSTYSELARLQAIYDREAAKLALARKQAVGSLTDAYRKGLNELQENLTKQGKISEALAIKSELQKMVDEELEQERLKDPEVKENLRIKEVITSRKWIRSSPRFPSGRFAFKVDGSTANNFGSHWNLWKAEGGKLVIVGPHKEFVFEVGKERPYTMNCITKGETDFLFTETE